MVWPCVRALAGALLRVSAATTRTSSSSSSAGGEQQQQEQQAAAAAGVPAHVAFIMDGNRRFADTHSLLRIDGHKQGYNRVRLVECVLSFSYSVCLAVRLCRDVCAARVS
jgi:hypothetical protein